MAESKLFVMFHNSFSETPVYLMSYTGYRIEEHKICEVMSIRYSSTLYNKEI